MKAVVPPVPRRASRAGAALLITLLMLSLIVIITVAFLGTMNWEASAARRYYESQKARSFAMLGMNTGVGQLRFALGSWDTPYTSFASSAPGFYWSVSPGILTRWSYTATAPQSNYPLFSLPPASNPTTNLVNLNAPMSDGTYPIAGGANAPDISVYWVNVLKNPTVTAAGAANPVIGRYAFWIDDENAKININTADGTMKYQTNSLGLGTPTEVSLQELQSGGANLTRTTATNIVYIARTTGFNTPREILRAAGTAPDLYTNNVFNLTVSSRSPDLNVFGQPKIALISTTSGNNNPYIGAVVGRYNCATLQPVKEIYPDWTQLGPSPLKFTNSYFNVTGNAANTFVLVNDFGAANHLPLTFAQEEEDSWLLTSGLAAGAANPYPWANGQVIANYLAGTNAGGGRITWPAFPGSTGTNYLSKYTPRQIDSITMQVCDMTASTSPDWGVDGFSAARSVPHTARGWLSGQLVSGAARFPKVDKVLLKLVAYPSQGTYIFGSTNSYDPPYLTATAYVEAWFPSRFQGVSLDHQDVGLADQGAFAFSPSEQPNALNSQDVEVNTLGKAGTNVVVIASPLPKSPVDGLADSLSYWGNNLLRTDQGIDWEGNNPNYLDSDQAMAALYHPYDLVPIGSYLYSSTKNQYFGAGASANNISPVFQMNPIVASPGLNEWDWAPGEYRCVSNGRHGTIPEHINMQPSASPSGGVTGNLNISGGIAVDVFGGTRISEAEIVPMESERGAGYSGTNYPGTVYDQKEGYSGESYSNSVVYNRTIESVIPISATVPVPANLSDTNAIATGGDTIWVYSTVADPLVNKFPGDWTTTVYTNSPPPGSALAGMQYASANTVQTNGCIYASYPESTATMGAQADPDSFWMPAIDNKAVMPNSIDPPVIPRSSRFPSAGYLQYVRTGIIPDDETLNYGPPLAPPYQHGTPYRLLNFSPSTAVGQAISHGGTLSQSYPDWAMLDLFYVPSSLLSYGSPYEALANPVYSSYTPTTSYHNNPTMVSYLNTNVVNNMYLFGTYGGATSGRINPNGAVIYTTNVNVPTPNVGRVAPFQALLHGLIVNAGQYSSATYNGDCHLLTPDAPALSASDETSIASDLTNFLGTNGPLRMPGEICNVPGVAGYLSAVNAAATSTVSGTRNDLVRQIVGNLTTQSNTFSIWVAGQSIVKSKANTGYGIVESGDQVLATVRYHFVVERYLDPGIDSVYGNNLNAGPDAIVGTLDDGVSSPAAPTNPGFANGQAPRYLYRVIYAEEVR